MDTAFIIAEYNPFHNGHLYHIQKTREITGAEAVVAVMSGNFVQRGDIAVGDKFLRAQAAVCSGVDLAVELPVKYAVSNAARFAAGAIKTIEAFGMEGTVSFGASASAEALRDAARCLTDETLLEQIETTSRTQGKTYPSALDAVLRRQGKEHTADILNDPNNVLAIEYLKSMAEYDRLKPVIVERAVERGHYAGAEAEGYAGASYVREQIYKTYLSDPEQFEAYLEEFTPPNAAAVFLSAYRIFHFPVDRTKYDVASYARLLGMSSEEFARLDNVSQGLENRIVSAVKENASVQDAVSAIKSKRYTMARIRQIFTAAVLGITKENVLSEPSYLRVLAFNETGKKLLAKMRKVVAVPIVTNLSDVVNDPVCTEDVNLEVGADKLFDLCLAIPRGGNRPFLDHPLYIKNSAGN